jgi:hypothetical protein
MAYQQTGAANTSQSRGNLEEWLLMAIGAGVSLMAFKAYGRAAR